MMLLPEMNRGVRGREGEEEEGGRDRGRVGEEETEGEKASEPASRDPGRRPQRDQAERATERPAATLGEEPPGAGEAAGARVGAVGGRGLAFGGGAKGRVVVGSGRGRGEGDGDGRGLAGRLIHQGKDQGPAESLTGGN